MIIAIVFLVLGILWIATGVVWLILHRREQKDASRQKLQD